MRIYEWYWYQARKLNVTGITHIVQIFIRGALEGTKEAEVSLKTYIYKSVVIISWFGYTTPTLVLNFCM